MYRTEAARWAALTIAVCSACSESNGPVYPEEQPPEVIPAALTLVAGDGQTGKAGEVLADAFVVQVSDVDGVGLPDVLVVWTATQGSGRFFDEEEWLDPPRTRTDADGRSAVTFRPETLGTSVVTASVWSVAEPVSFTARSTTLIIGNDFWGYFLSPTGESDVTVPLGTTIEWLNYMPGSVHVEAVDVPEGGTAFVSGRIGEGERFVFIPEVTGTWRYEWYYHDAPDIREEASVTVYPP